MRSSRQSPRVLRHHCISTSSLPCLISTLVDMCLLRSRLLSYRIPVGHPCQIDTLTDQLRYACQSEQVSTTTARDNVTERLSIFTKQRRDSIDRSLERPTSPAHHLQNIDSILRVSSSFDLLVCKLRIMPQYSPTDMCTSIDNRRSEELSQDCHNNKTTMDIVL